MEKVEADTCFDLFCGEGTFLDALYADRFSQVVAVDKRHAALEELPDADHVAVYQGDCIRLIPALVRKFGLPDYVDLDAWGSPDTALVALLRSCRKLQRIAIVATDGVWCSLNRSGPANHLPACWGYSKTWRAPQSAGIADYPTILYRHLEDWAARRQLAVTDFDCYRGQGHNVFYWGALLERIQAP